MVNRPTTVLSYIGAWLTIGVAMLAPFLIVGGITQAVARSGVRVDSAYTGGEVARTISKNGYQIAIYSPVRPRFLQRTEAYVQIAWRPVDALPSAVQDSVDLDGDGRADVRVAFQISADPRAAMKVNIVSLNPQYLGLRGAQVESFSRLIVRTDKAILVRIPLRAEALK